MTRVMAPRSGGGLLRSGKWFSGVLAVADFRRYFIGQAISQLGDRLVPVALAFAVLDRTRSAADLALVLASETIAELAFLLAGGVIADRAPRRLVMLWSDVAQLLATGALGALLVLGRPAVAVIAAAGAVQGVASAMFLPAAAGLVPALVSAGQLPAANALTQLTGAATRVAGPAIAGILVTTAGPGWAIVVDAVSFTASVGSLARLDAGRAGAGRLPRAGRRAWLTELRDGWAAFRGQTWMWAMSLGTLAANFAWAVVVVLGPVASLRYYDGAATWSAINAVGAAGSVAGGLATTRLRPRHPLRWALPAGACFALIPLALAAGLPTAEVAALAAVGETGLLISARLYLTAVQQALPEQMRSRVSAFESLGSLAVYPLGLACAEPLERGLGTRPALVQAGLMMMVPMLGLLIVPSVRSVVSPPSAGPACRSRSASAASRLEQS
jgi:MFS family permease